ncbi:VOC family protein [Spongiactinospora sp. TRM90649]|uniref:VOC family protein n=1 Tax=Spongiactinospora sp. TRM90649 TaxID=3031114 RepID=UPI0023F7B189|nr:VOC family protein [Spongiactinospora sp. TRM90649]MDF5754520.1 VOC family protein [Spongiactinospora sp. TRM90649]
MTTTQITHARFVSVPVADQDRALDFYTGALGFEVLIDQRMGPKRWIQVAPKGAQTGFTLIADDPSYAPGSARGILLETSDLDGDCARLTEAGIPVEGPADLPWGRQATLTDPDGNAFVLAAPAAF